MTDNVFPTIQKCAAEVLLIPADQVTPEADLIEDLQATSLARVEIMMALEEAFGIKVPDEDVSMVRTIEDIHQIVLKLS